MTADEKTTPAEEIWQREVDAVPELRDAVARADDSGRTARARARHAAEELDAEALTEGEIALALQEAAAQGARRRERIRDARIGLHDENDGVAVRNSRSSRWRSMEPGEWKDSILFLVPFIGAFVGPILLLEAPRDRTGGPFFTADAGAFWSGVISLLSAIVLLAIRGRALKIARGRPYIIGAFVLLMLLTGAAFLTALLTTRHPDAGVYFGIGALAAATVLHGVTAYLFCTQRSDALPQTLFELDTALSAESDHEATVRRAAYADAVRVLLQREVIDAATARTLLRVYAR